jgi:pSer/pThr/pTyr-binding forkhead associated (FHA) protein
MHEFRIDRQDHGEPDVAPADVAYVELEQPANPSGRRLGFHLDRRRIRVGFSCSDVNVRTGVDGMSRQHAIFERRDGRWWCSDGGSTNGTRHNGAALGRQPRALADGDRLELGPNHVFVFRAAPPE